MPEKYRLGYSLKEVVVGTKKKEDIVLPKQVIFF